MSDMIPYVVRQGDHLRKLSHRVGADPDAVWEHPLNAPLRANRDSGDDLHPGDVIFLPDGPVHALDLISQSNNAYLAAVPRVQLDLLFEDLDGPLGNEPCRILGLPGTGAQGIAKTADADGRVKVQVPVTLPELTVEFTNRHHIFAIQIGHMDPINEASGVRKRLANYGYLDPRGITGDPAIGTAIAHFQKNAGIDPTGMVDDATRARLQAEAGVPAQKEGK